MNNRVVQLPSHSRDVIKEMLQCPISAPSRCTLTLLAIAVSWSQGVVTKEDRAALLTCFTMPVAAVWGDGVATVAIVRSTLWWEGGSPDHAPVLTGLRPYTKPNRASVRPTACLYTGSSSVGSCVYSFHVVFQLLQRSPVPSQQSRQTVLVNMHPLHCWPSILFQQTAEWADLHTHTHMHVQEGKRKSTRLGSNTSTIC